MLDRWTAAAVRPTLHNIASVLAKSGVTPNQVTVAGFFIGIGALPALATEHYLLAMMLIIINRVFDGLDGALARITGITDLGGFLDVVLDFIFYALIILGFALAAPEENALSAAALLCGFMATGSSFLAFAVIAAKRGIVDTVYQNKSLHYLGGLAEGTETILFFLVMTLFPGYFPEIAGVFTAICVLTAFSRVMAGVFTFRNLHERTEP